jgi:hypothetical protein
MDLDLFCGVLLVRGVVIDRDVGTVLLKKGGVLGFDKRFVLHI